MALRWLIVGLLAGCGVEQAEFEKRFPVEVCERTSECLDQVWIDRVGTVCESSWRDAIEDLKSRDCEYDGGQARQCLKAVAGDCEERTALYYECKKVFRGEGDTCTLEVSLPQPAGP